MTFLPISRMRAAVAIAVISTALLVVACGGGGSDANTADGRAMPLAAGLGQAITWTPASITDTANPGSRQDIPVTFTASANVANVSISVVPALQKLVSLSPTSFASLQKGQVVKLTLSVAPSATAALGTVQGAVQVRTGGATIASPLTVTLTLVAPELVNWIAVPPEPPADLNNATLAGFDANGNGVRDDVERVIARQFGGAADYSYAMAYAKVYQEMITIPTPTQRSAAIAEISKQDCAIKGATQALIKFNMDALIINTLPRKQARRAFSDVLVALTHREDPPCAQ